MTCDLRGKDTTVEALAEWKAEMTLLSLEVAARYNQWAYHEIGDGCRLYAIWDGEAVRFRRWPTTSGPVDGEPLTREQAAELLREHKVESILLPLPG